MRRSFIAALLGALLTVGWAAGAQAQAYGPQPPRAIADYLNADEVPRTGGTPLQYCPPPVKNVCKNIVGPTAGSVLQLFANATALPSNFTLSNGALSGGPGQCTQFRIVPWFDSELTVENTTVVIYTDGDVTSGGTVSATTSSAATATNTVNSSGVVVLTNNGSQNVFYALGTTSGVTAAATNQFIAAGQTIAVALNGNTYFALLSASGTQSVQWRLPNAAIPLFSLGVDVLDRSGAQYFYGFQNSHIYLDNDMASSVPGQQLGVGMKVPLVWRSAVEIDVIIPPATTTSPLWYDVSCQLNSIGPWGRFAKLRSGFVGTIGQLDTTPQQFGSISSTTLSSAITTTGATSASLTAALYTRAVAFTLIQIDNEIMLVTAGGNTTTLTVTRGWDGTTAATHSNGATVTPLGGGVSVAAYETNAATLFNMTTGGPGALYFNAIDMWGSGAGGEGAPMSTPDGASAYSYLANGQEDYHLHSFGGQHCPSATDVEGWFSGPECINLGVGGYVGYRFHDRVGPVMWNISELLQQPNGNSATGGVSGNATLIDETLFTTSY